MGCGIHRDYCDARHMRVRAQICLPTEVPPRIVADGQAYDDLVYVPARTDARHGP